jgi:tetratricopeptide (TPR) repeat protein
MSALAQTRRGAAGVSPRLMARVLAHQGRVARQLGDLDAAQDSFEAILSLAAETRDAEIAARGWYGLGGVAFMRGNHPVARERYETACRAAERAGSDELIGLAHRGLLIVAATAGDFDAAIRHGGQALARSSAHNATSHAELLANIAAVCTDAGHHRAAFSAYMVAAHLGGALRVTLSALGGAALAAARMNDLPTVAELAATIDSEVARGTPPYETAQVMIDLARAFSLHLDLRARAYAESAARLATTHRYFEMQFAAEELLGSVSAWSRSEPGRTPQALSEESRLVLDGIVSLARGSTASSGAVHYQGTM